MAKIIRKQIDLSTDVVTAVKVLAALKDTNAKKYIEMLVIEHVKGNIEKVKHFSMLKS